MTTHNKNSFCQTIVIFISLKVMENHFWIFWSKDSQNKINSILIRSPSCILLDQRTPTKGMDTLQEFLESSTIHGLSYISSAQVKYFLLKCTLHLKNMFFRRKLQKSSGC